MSESSAGPQFLKEKYDLHNTPEVKSAVERTEARTGEPISQHPYEQINNYLGRFREIIDRADPDKRERGIQALKKILYNEFVIKPEEIPKGYWEYQKQIMRERGHGGDLGQADWETLQNQNTEAIIADQESSLDAWIDYFASEDTTYPNWLKYYAMRNVLKMGKYDKEKKSFQKRSKGTTNPFPEINREALAYTLDAIEKKRKGEKIDFPDTLEKSEKQRFNQLLQGTNFSKLYALAIEKATPSSLEGLKSTQGEWVKYEQNSDHMPLVNSLQGHGTGWCTAGESTAKSQLQGGDFYVYYSLDSEGKPTIPRAAIRMEESNIAEVRGIAEQQNLDPYIGKVVDKKLGQFPDGERYKKRTADMERLTAITEKQKNSEELSTEELRFLYEIDDKIEGFGYSRDPRIKEIRNRRDIKVDIAHVFGCKKENISTTPEEALRGDIKFHYGDLELGDIKKAKGLELPAKIGGTLNLESLESAERLELPSRIGSSLILNSLQNAEGLKFPNRLDGSLYLGSMKSAEGVEFPNKIFGSLILNQLESDKGLKLPSIVIGGDLDLNSLESIEDVKFPSYGIGGSVKLHGIKNARNVRFPTIVGRNLHLGNLESAESLELPDKIGGNLYLRSLENTEDLELPTEIHGSLMLDALKSAKNLKFPQKVGEDIRLMSLVSAKGLRLPNSVGDSVYLGGKLGYEELESIYLKHPDIKIVPV